MKAGLVLLNSELMIATLQFGLATEIGHEGEITGTIQGYLDLEDELFERVHSRVLCVIIIAS